MTEAATTLYFPQLAYAMIGSYSRETVNDTTIETAFTGFEQRQQNYPSPGFEKFAFTTIPLQMYRPEVVDEDTGLTTLGQAPAFALKKFIRLCHGRRDTFYFFAWENDYFENGYLGSYPNTPTHSIGYMVDPTSSALTDVIEPDSAGGFDVLYADNVPQRVVDDYTIRTDPFHDNLTGLPSGVSPPWGGETVIDWVNPPAPGASLVASFLGRQRFQCRLDSDREIRNLFAGGATDQAIQRPLVQWQLSFRQVK